MANPTPTNPLDERPLTVEQAIERLRDMASESLPRSCGACGTPYGNCDGDCMDAAYGSRAIAEAVNVLRNARLAARDAAERQRQACGMIVLKDYEDETIAAAMFMAPLVTDETDGSDVD